MHWLFPLVVSLLPVFALADDPFPLFKDDTPLTRDEVVALTQKHRVAFYEGGLSRYSVGGSYSYTYQGGGTAYGTFEVGADGVICIAYKNGRDRCDKFVRSHGRVVMITESGDRYPIRP